MLNLKETENMRTNLIIALSLAGALLPSAAMAATISVPRGIEAAPYVTLVGDGQESRHWNRHGAAWDTPSSLGDRFTRSYEPETGYALGRPARSGTYSDGLAAPRHAPQDSWLYSREGGGGGRQR